MRIAFSGHRDKQATAAALDAVRAIDPLAVWVHGGAIGFDQQVETYAKAHAIRTEVIRPDYARYGKGAPLKRNHAIVDGADMLVVCYDGRKSGGTFYTLSLARRCRLPIHYAGIQE